MENRKTRAAVYAMPLDGPPRPVFTPERGTFTAFRPNLAGTHAGLVLQSPAEPPEAYVAKLAASVTTPLRVSAANPGLAPVARTELLRWKAKDGLEIEGLLTWPERHSKGARAPLILIIHGGPSGVFGETFIGAAGPYPIASFAAKGYAVLRPNPRGSTGYGHDFRQRVISDWGGLDFQDLMAGVDHAIAQGIADPDKLAVMGWSYGGYMTAWTVTQTQRFKAATVGAGITNTISMYGTQDVPTLFEHYFDTLPWEKPDIYARSSPLNFIARVTTPTLILHGENDPRVPAGQGYEFHRALKRRGVPVKMVVYPRMGHGLTEPKFIQNAMEQHLEWVEKWLK
jgi:dipeptidyl aminopeptidase/acylaminoacyl peptidase